MALRYKFKNELDYTTLLLDAFYISVVDLKRAVVRDRRLGRQTDFDLEVLNAEDNATYVSDEEQIPKNTTLIILRKPLPPGKHKVWEAADVELDAPIQSECVTTTKFDDDSISEEDKLQSVVSSSSSGMYDRRNWVYHRGSRSYHGTRSSGIPPPTYKCVKCNQGGHFFHNCPINNDMEIKKTTGIPRSFLQKADKDTIGVKLDSRGEFMINQMETEAYKNKKIDIPVWNDETAGANKSTSAPSDGSSNATNSADKPGYVNGVKVPDDLMCEYCHDILKDCVMMPECACSICDECARKALFESDKNECPFCGEANNSIDDLIPCRQVRDKVAKFLTGGTGKDTNPNTGDKSASSQVASHAQGVSRVLPPTTTTAAVSYSLPQIHLPNLLPLGASTATMQKILDESDAGKYLTQQQLAPRLPTTPTTASKTSKVQEATVDAVHAHVTRDSTTSDSDSLATRRDDGQLSATKADLSLASISAITVPTTASSVAIPSTGQSPRHRSDSSSGVYGVKGVSGSVYGGTGRYPQRPHSAIQSPPLSVASHLAPPVVPTAAAVTVPPVANPLMMMIPPPTLSLSLPPSAAAAAAATAHLLSQPPPAVVHSVAATTAGLPTIAPPTAPLSAVDDPLAAFEQAMARKDQRDIMLGRIPGLGPLHRGRSGMWRGPMRPPYHRYTNAYDHRSHDHYHHRERDRGSERERERASERDCERSSERSRDRGSERDRERSNERSCERGSERHRQREDRDRDVEKSSGSARGNSESGEKVEQRRRRHSTSLSRSPSSSSRRSGKSRRHGHDHSDGRSSRRRSRSRSASRGHCHRDSSGRSSSRRDKQEVTEKPRRSNHDAVASSHCATDVIAATQDDFSKNDIDLRHQLASRKASKAVAGTDCVDDEAVRKDDLEPANSDAATAEVDNKILDQHRSDNDAEADIVSKVEDGGPPELVNDNDVDITDIKAHKEKKMRRRDRQHDEEASTLADVGDEAESIHRAAGDIDAVPPPSSTSAEPGEIADGSNSNDGGQDGKCDEAAIKRQTKKADREKKRLKQERLAKKAKKQKKELKRMKRHFKAYLSLLKDGDDAAALFAAKAKNGNGDGNDESADERVADNPVEPTAPSPSSSNSIRRGRVSRDGANMHVPGAHTTASAAGERLTVTVHRTHASPPPPSAAVGSRVMDDKASRAGRFDLSERRRTDDDERYFPARDVSSTGSHCQRPRDVRDKLNAAQSKSVANSVRHRSSVVVAAAAAGNGVSVDAHNTLPVASANSVPMTSRGKRLSVKYRLGPKTGSESPPPHQRSSSTAAAAAAVSSESRLNATNGGHDERKRRHSRRHVSNESGGGTHSKSANTSHGRSRQKRRR